MKFGSSVEDGHGNPNFPLRLDPGQSMPGGQTRVLVQEASSRGELRVFMKYVSGGRNSCAVKASQLPYELLLL